MHEQIGLYLKKLEKKKHLFELIKNKNLSVTFVINSHEYCLFFQNGVVRERVESIKDFVMARIGGEESAIISLLNGELKLRSGEAINQLEVSGSFRSKLLIESLLYLGGKNNS